MSKKTMDLSELESKLLQDTALVEFLKGEGKIIFDIKKEDWPTYEKASTALKIPSIVRDVSTEDLNLKYRDISEHRLYLATRIDEKEKVILRIKNRLDSLSKKHHELSSKFLNNDDKLKEIESKTSTGDTSVMNQRLIVLKQESKSISEKISEKQHELDNTRQQVLYLQERVKTKTAELQSAKNKHITLNDLHKSQGEFRHEVERLSDVNTRYAKISIDLKKLQEYHSKINLEMSQISNRQKEAHRQFSIMRHLQVENRELNKGMLKYQKQISLTRKKLSNERKIRLDLVKQKEELDIQAKYLETQLMRRDVSNFEHSQH